MDSLKILNTLTRAVFPEIEYLEWVSGRPEEAVYDLGSSGLGKRYDGVLPSPLEGLEDPSPETDLEDQIAEEYDVPDENVLVTAGASHANFMIASISLDRGSTVLVEKPGYEPLVATPRGLGANVRRFNRPKDEDYTIGIEEVKGKINDDTCLITVTNRHNPSGRLVERDALRKLAEVAEDHDAYLLVDEVYVPYVSQPKTDTALGSVTGAGLPNTIVTNSLTKFYGLGEIRIGWAIAKDDIIQKLSSVSAHVPTVARTSVSMAE
ncbi:MAG: pyridoxal phosphate-dependent aminotransferase, partial [Halobacteria archaeon]|nr:pyridoxal phosphate-dependent aminotransferase [Halobacteria archaeon]